MNHIEEIPLPPNVSQRGGYVSVRVKSRSVDKRFFAPTVEDLMKRSSKSFSLAQETMVGSRRICEANASPRRAFVLRGET